VSDEVTTGLESHWRRLPTGLKMLIILSIGLLPLGIIAIMASVDSARASRAKSGVEAKALLAVHVQRYTSAVSRNTYTIRAARDAIIEARDPAGICARTLGRLARYPNTPGRFALFGGEATPRCVTGGFAPPLAPPARGQVARVFIRPGGELMDVFLYDPSGAIEGIAEFRRETIAAVVDNPPMDGNFALELVQGDRVMALRNGAQPSSLEGETTTDFPFAQGQFVLRLRSAAPEVTASDLLAILSPVLMWLWASLVGWLIVQRLLLQPLRRIQNVISAYRPGDSGIDLPSIRSPAREISALGEAFDRVTRTVYHHEAELEAAVFRQTRLVREVHHRVKNNLQVVASLLNLHARGATGDDVAAAYASIQRRVDALAVVHRNHYAELEDNKGVALKPLISELAANLRANAPARATSMQIRLDIGSFYATQDVAVSVAFLVTEIVEFGMLCGANIVSVALDADEPGGARLSVEVDALAGDVDCDPALQERFDRIITGLARQLRSTLTRDADLGLYSVRITVVDDDDRA
jgi:two-component sensor histidine kinase